MTFTLEWEGGDRRKADEISGLYASYGIYKLRM